MSNALQVQCYQCGTAVSTELVYRRNLRTSGLLGWSQGTGFGLAGGWQRVNLCVLCAAEHDEREQRGNRILWIAFATFVIGGLAFGLAGCLLTLLP